MIVVDTSALIAILLEEAEALQFANAIAEADIAYVGAPTAFEFMMVAEGRSTAAVSQIAADLLKTPSIEVLPWTADHAALARDAFRLFGKGRGKSAKLNFGDCMAYAVAKSLDAPLLYKGNDFAQTDIRRAV